MITASEVPHLQRCLDELIGRPYQPDRYSDPGLVGHLIFEGYARIDVTEYVVRTGVPFTQEFLRKELANN